MLHLLLCAILYMQSAASDEVVLPRLNYWDLSERLVHDTSLQTQLNISPSQLSQVRSLLTDSVIHEMNDELLSESDDFESTADLWLEMDPVVKKKLLEFLDENQLKGLRQLSLRKLFKNPLDCFRSVEVLMLIGVKPPFESLEVAVQKEQRDLDSAILRVRKECSDAIHSVLPPHASHRLHDYCGCIDDLQQPSSRQVNIELMPFTNITKTEGLYSASTDSMAQKKVKLSPSQVNTLREILDAGPTKLELTTNVSEMKKRTEAAEREVAKKMRNVLSDDQYLQLMRYTAFCSLCADFRKFFERRELIQYLEISSTELQAVEEMATRQSTRLTQEVERLQNNSFNAVAQMLSENSRAKLLKMFGGGWKFKVEGRK